MGKHTVIGIPLITDTLGKLGSSCRSVVHTVIVQSSKKKLHAAKNVASRERTNFLRKCRRLRIFCSTSRSSTASTLQMFPRECHALHASHNLISCIFTTSSMKNKSLQESNDDDSRKSRAEKVAFVHLAAERTTIIYPISATFSELLHKRHHNDNLRSLCRQQRRERRRHHCRVLKFSVLPDVRGKTSPLPRPVVVLVFRRQEI